MESADLNQLYLKLQKELQQGQSAEAIAKACEQISAKTQDANVKDIYAVALIKSSRFDAAEQHFRNNTPQSEEQQFQFGYTLYKQNKNKELLAYLDKGKQSGLRFTLLRAQALHKTNQFQESSALYEQVLSQISSSERNDLLTNLLASQTLQRGATHSCASSVEEQILRNDFTRELLFNLSLFYTSQHQLKQARTVLQNLQRILGAQPQPEDQVRPKISYGRSLI